VGSVAQTTTGGHRGEIKAQRGERRKMEKKVRKEEEAGGSRQPTVVSFAISCRSGDETMSPSLGDPFFP